MLEGMLEDRKYAPANLGKVLVLGLGTSGKAVVSYCAPLLGTRVESLAVAGGAYSDASAQFIEPFKQQGVTVEFDKYDIQGSYDLCIASPGISMFEPFYQSAQAASGEIISEVEFAWRESAADSTWVAITGTNGKTTTTALAAHLAKECGMKAAAVGNIGDSCITAVASGAVDVYIAEVSSYQMASTSRFAPKVSVLTNITPDHLHWHKTHKAYAAAKAKVFDNLASVEGSLAILDATDDEARALVRAMRAQGEQLGYRYLAVGTADGLYSDMHVKCGAQNSAFVNDQHMLSVRLGQQAVTLGTVSDLQIKGAHNVSNALVAASAILALGGNAEAITRGLASFAPLEHRIEPCGSVAGIPCYNDSKATNVDATLVAISAFVPAKPVMLLGGDDKGTDLSVLVKKCCQYAAAAVCYGEAAERFMTAFQGASIPVVQAPHMREAFDAALQLAQPGDVILLSPACASFDEFKSFEHRGRVFKDLVAQKGSEVS